MLLPSANTLLSFLIEKQGLDIIPMGGEESEKEGLFITPL